MSAHGSGQTQNYGQKKIKIASSTKVAPQSHIANFSVFGVTQSKSHWRYLHTERSLRPAPRRHKHTNCARGKERGTKKGWVAD